MSSTLFCLCISTLACASGEGEALTNAPPSKPEEARSCLDFRIVSNLRKQLQEAREWQQLRRTQLRRWRQLNEACLGSYQKLVEEAELRVRRADVLVDNIERNLRSWGMNPSGR